MDTPSPEEKAREIIDRAANQADYLDIQAAYQKFISIIAEALREASHPSHSKRKKGQKLDPIDWLYEGGADEELIKKDDWDSKTVSLRRVAGYLIAYRKYLES